MIQILNVLDLFILGSKSHFTGTHFDVILNHYYEFLYMYIMLIWSTLAVNLPNITIWNSLPTHPTHIIFSWQGYTYNWKCKVVHICFWYKTFQSMQVISLITALRWSCIHNRQKAYYYHLSICSVNMSVGMKFFPGGHIYLQISLSIIYLYHLYFQHYQP